jgi:hypothetical protein
MPTSSAISVIGLSLTAWAISMSEGTGRFSTRRVALKAGRRDEDLAFVGAFRALRFAVGRARDLGIG